MSGFLGRHECQMDAKGRVSFPSAFRRTVWSSSAGSCASLVLLQWQDTHLDVLPGETWKKIQERLLEHRRARRDGGAYLRRITASAIKVDPDQHGRIRIPTWLGDKADLNRTVLFVGALDRIELWNPVRFEEHMKASGADDDNFADQIFG